MKDSYVVTVKVRMRVPASTEHSAKVSAIVGLLDAKTAEELGYEIEWLDNAIVACRKD